jgi:hypothetical protein
MRSSNSVRIGKKAVDEAVDQPVEQERGPLDRRLALLVALPDLGEGRAVVAMHGHQAALRVEAVHLDEPVGIGRGAVDDDEDEVVVLVQLGALAEVLRVLDRKRVELEDVRQDLEVGACPAGRDQARRSHRRRAASRRSPC